MVIINDDLAQHKVKSKNLPHYCLSFQVIFETSLKKKNNKVMLM